MTAMAATGKTAAWAMPSSTRVATGTRRPLVSGIGP